MTEFRYRAIYSPRLEKTIFRPYARALLSHGRSQIMCEMLIDSGADISVLSKSLGEALGLRLKRGEKIDSLRGLGGEIPTAYRALNIRDAFDCEISRTCITSQTQHSLSRRRFSTLSLESSAKDL